MEQAEGSQCSGLHTFKEAARERVPGKGPASQTNCLSQTEHAYQLILLEKTLMLGRIDGRKRRG